MIAKILWVAYRDSGWSVVDSLGYDTDTTESFSLAPPGVHFGPATFHDVTPPWRPEPWMEWAAAALVAVLVVALLVWQRRHAESGDASWNEHGIDGYDEPEREPIE